MYDVTDLFLLNFDNNRNGLFIKGSLVPGRIQRLKTVLLSYPCRFSVGIAISGYLLLSTLFFLVYSTYTHLALYIHTFQFITVIIAVFLFLVVYGYLKKKKELIEQQTKQDEINSLRRLSWGDFELLIREYFRQQAFKLVKPKFTHQCGEVDLLFYKKNTHYIVQCRHWRSKTIGISTVRELYEVLLQMKKNKLIIISSGNYTHEAKAFASDKPIQLVSGDELLLIMQKINISEVVLDNVNKENIDYCPACGDLLIKQRIQNSRYLGQDFYICIRYPQCQYQQKLAQMGAVD